MFVLANDMIVLIFDYGFFYIIFYTIYGYTIYDIRLINSKKVLKLIIQIIGIISEFEKGL